MDHGDENSSTMLRMLSVELISYIFERMPHRDGLRLASTCYLLWCIFKNCGNIWKAYLLRDFETCQARFGVQLDEIFDHWGRNINDDLSYRDCWEDIRMQRMSILICQSQTGEYLKKTFLFTTADQEDRMIDREVFQNNGTNPQKILCIGPVQDPSVFLLFINEIIGGRQWKLTKQMNGVFCRHKSEFLVGTLLDGTTFLWKNKWMVNLIVDVCALIAIIEYFSLPCEITSKKLDGAYTLITVALRQARALAEKYRLEIWRAYNLKNVVPRALIDPPCPEKIEMAAKKKKIC